MQHTDFQRFTSLLKFQGMRYFISKGLVADSATEIAKFIHGTTSLARAQVNKVKKTVVVLSLKHAKNLNKKSSCREVRKNALPGSTLC